jgi:general secretion pathway protein K
LNLAPCTSQKGIALLMVLWIMAFLTVMVLSFSLVVRSDVYSTLSFKENMQNRLLAEAGIERAVMEIFYYNTNKNQKTILEEKEIIKIDGTQYTGRTGNGNYTFCIIDESGKININLLTDSTRIIFYNLLVNYGISNETADTITDSLLDWKDSDELHRLNGAESDYYMSLPDPYESKNSNFDTLEELLLVKGVTPEILYGDEKDKSGIIHFLTIHSNTNKINLKSAPKEILMAIPGLSEDLVDNIITLRESAPEEIINHLQAVMGKDYNTTASYIGVLDSNIYTIDSTGYLIEKKKGYAIRSTVIMESNNTTRTVYYKSPA